MPVIFMLSFYNDEGVIAEMSAEQQNALVEAHVTFGFDVLGKGGHMLGGRGLQPSPTGRTVRLKGGASDVSPGVATPTSNMLTGFYLVDCADIEEAVELAKRYPTPEHLGCIEVRPVMQDWHYAPSTVTAASAAAVWHCYTDVASWPDWKVGVARVELDGPFAAGASGLLTPPGQDPMPFHVLSADENTGYISETELTEGLTLRLEHTLEPAAEGGTRITHSVTMPRAALDVFGIDFSPDFNEGMRATLATLARRAETQENQLSGGTGVSS